MDNFKKRQNKKRKIVLLSFIAGMIVVGAVFLFSNININTDSKSSIKTSEQSIEDLFVDEKQTFDFEDYVVQLHNGKYIIDSKNNSSYFSGNYLLFNTKDNNSSIVKCVYDTHQTIDEIEFYNENNSDNAFQFILSVDENNKYNLKAADTDKISFNDMIF